MTTAEKPKPKSRLKAIDPKSVEPKKPRILISGSPNVGKTWVSMDFPLVYFMDVEGGATRKHYQDKLSSAKGAYFGQGEGSLDFSNVLNEIKTLATEEHAFKTLAIDSISKLYYEEISREAERLGDKDAYGASKKPAVGYMRRLLSWANRIDMTVIMIAHSKIMWGLDGKGVRTEIGTTFDAWDKLEYELDLWLEIFKEGPGHFARIRKSRLEAFPFGDRFPWSYEEFAKRYGKEIIEKEAKPIVLATEDQVKEISRLLETLKTEDGFIDKCLTKAGVSSIAELEHHQAGAVIENLRGKMPK